MMLIKKRRAVPKWLFATGLILLLISSLTGTLVYAARQQPADDQRCLKISPDGGDFSYVYFDVSNGTRLNMPRHDLDGSYDQVSQDMPSPDGSKDAVLIRSRVSPVSQISLKSMITGAQKISPVSDQYPLDIIWSNDSNYIAVITRNPNLDDAVVVLSATDFKEMVSIPASPLITLWASRSNRLAFMEQHKDKTYWLSILNIDAPNDASRLTSVRLPDDTLSDFAGLQWSPDGQFIVVHTVTEMGVASANGGTFQMISPNVRIETWIADTTTLAYVDVDDNSTLNAYDPRAQTSKILASGIKFYGSDFSPDGRYALLSYLGSAGETTFRIMNLATGDVIMLGTSLAEPKIPQVHWSEDNQSVVVVMPDKVLWADLLNPRSPVVRESPIENLSYWDFLPDNSWMRGVSPGGPSEEPQYLNLQTGDRYVWKQTNTSKDRFFNAWPNNLISESVDMPRGAIKHVTSLNPYATVDLGNVPPPWLEHTKFLISIAIESTLNPYNYSRVLLRRTDGTLVWAIHGVGSLQDTPDAVRWINCQTLR